VKKTSNIKFRLLSVAVVIAMAATLGMQAAATITTDIVGWWPFNEESGLTAYDASQPYGGGSNNGTLRGAASFATDSKRGNVLNIYGVSGQVEFPFTTDLQPATGTVAIWVKPTVAQLADVIRQNTDMLVRCNKVGTFYAYGLRVDARGTPIAMIANDNPKSCAKSPQILASGSSNQVKSNQWTHLAMTWDGRSLLIYVNGRKVGSAAYSPNPNTGLSFHGTMPLRIAAAIWDFDNGYLEYSGQLDDLRIYARALSASEIYSIAVNGH
jgi:hypothetical protein